MAALRGLMTVGGAGPFTKAAAGLRPLPAGRACPRVWTVRLRPAPAPAPPHPARKVIALLGLLASLLGAGRAVVPRSATPVGGPPPSFRPRRRRLQSPPGPSAPAPSRAVRPSAGSRLAARSACGTGQAEAVAAQHHRAAPAQDPGTEPGPAVSPRPRRLRWPLPPRQPWAAAIGAVPRARWIALRTRTASSSRYLRSLSSSTAARGGRRAPAGGSP